jgi:hypothetical protein
MAVNAIGNGHNRSGRVRLERLERDGIMSAVVAAGYETADRPIARTRGQACDTANIARLVHSLSQTSDATPAFRRVRRLP